MERGILNLNIRFNADEVFAIAERMEQNAAVFYRTAAGKIQYPGARQLLLDLEGWEHQHERFFSDLRKQLAGLEKEAPTYDPYSEAAQYIQALTDHTVYTLSQDPFPAFGTEPTFEQILNYAIARERDAVSFYTGIREFVPARLGKDKIDAIIQEEKRHVTILTEQLRKVADQNRTGRT
jgi:rubrerythrin